MEVQQVKRIIQNLKIQYRSVYDGNYEEILKQSSGVLCQSGFAGEKGAHRTGGCLSVELLIEQLTQLPELESTPAGLIAKNRSKTLIILEPFK